MAGKGTEIVVATLRIGAPDSRDPLQVVAAYGKLLSDLLDSLESEHAVLGSVLLIVLLAEVRKVMIEDRVKLVTAPGDVLRGWSRGSGVGMHCGSHIGRYREEVAPASMIIFARRF